MTTTATIVLIANEPRSSCCKAGLTALRDVHDTVSFSADSFEDGVLHVRYMKVYEGEADEFRVACDTCNQPIDVEVEED